MSSITTDSVSSRTRWLGSRLILVEDQGGFAVASLHHSTAQILTITNSGYRSATPTKIDRINQSYWVAAAENCGVVLK